MRVCGIKHPLVVSLEAALDLFTHNVWLAAACVVRKGHAWTPQHGGTPAAVIASDARLVFYPNLRSHPLSLIDCQM